MSLITKFLDFSLPLKILTSALITSLAGSGILYFIVEYETYFYVLSKGIRLPFEGVQYLSASVALLGLIIAICATLVFILTRYFLMVIANNASEVLERIIFLYNHGRKAFIKEKGFFFKSVNFSDIQKKIEKQPYKNIFWVLFTLYWFLYFIIELIDPAEKVAVRYFLIFFLSVSILSLWRKSFSWFASAMLVFLVYFVFINTILDFDKYKIFLQAVGYGGGIPVRVQYKDTKEYEEFKLILRTKTFLLTSKNKLNQYSEIPIENLRKITYLKSNEVEKYLMKLIEPYTVKKSDTPP